MEDHLPIKGTRRQCDHCSTKQNQQCSNIECIKFNLNNNIDEKGCRPTLYQQHVLAKKETWIFHYDPNATPEAALLPSALTERDQIEDVRKDTEDLVQRERNSDIDDCLCDDLESLLTIRMKVLTNSIKILLREHNSAIPCCSSNILYIPDIPEQLDTSFINLLPTAEV